MIMNKLCQLELDSIDMDMELFGFDLSSSGIDWETVEDLSEQTYEEPKKTMLQCPHCGHVDSTTHFMKVSEE